MYILTVWSLNMAVNCVANIMRVKIANNNASNDRKSSKNIVVGGEYGEHCRHSVCTHCANSVTTKNMACMDIAAM